MRINTKVVLEWRGDRYVETYCDSYNYNGPIDECKGGGTSGAVEHPSYIESTYQLLVTGEVADPIAADYTVGSDAGDAGINLLNAMAIATTVANPYASATSFVPDSYISSSQDEWATANTTLTGTGVTTDTTRWESMHDSAKGKADALFTGDEIDDAVDAYAEKTVDEFNATVNRYSAGMAEANAIHSSAFIIGMSLIERKRLDDINKQRSVLTLENERRKTEYMQKAIGDMVNLMNMHMGNRLELLRFQMELNRNATIFKKEQYAQDLEFDRTDALWDIEVIAKGASVMSAPGGGQYMPEKPSTIASAASGTLAGAATGATIGTAIGGPAGAAAGAVIGGIGGLLGGIA